MVEVKKRNKQVNLKLNHCNILSHRFKLTKQHKNSFAYYIYLSIMQILGISNYIPIETGYLQTIYDDSKVVSHYSPVCY